MYQRLSFFFIILMFVISCDEHSEQAENTFQYLLFGHFYGFCGGEQCLEIFKLTENDLFEDTKDQYPSREVFYDGDYVKLDNEKFKLVQSLKDEITLELTLEKKTCDWLTGCNRWWRRVLCHCK